MIEPVILQMQEGKSIDMRTAIEDAIKDASKDCESNLLIATDEDCNSHAPLTKLSKDQRVRQLAEQPENEDSDNRKWRCERSIAS